MEPEQIIKTVVSSECFKSEAGWLERGGVKVARRPRLFKMLDHPKVRLIFPTSASQMEEGVPVGLVCLFDLTDQTTVYAHAIFAGPRVNSSLHNFLVPAGQAKPQPGTDGYKAILHFEAWKGAGWSKFLNDELELGNEKASRVWIANFWKALDRMYGDGNLIEETSL